MVALCPPPSTIVSRDDREETARMSILPTEGRPAERLASEPIAWLTTIRTDDIPASSPVWFVVHHDAVYVQSQPGAGKLRNIAAHPGIAFHLDSDGAGGDIVTIEGKAEALDGAPDGLLDVYFGKYEALIRERMKMEPEQLAEQYSTTIRISPLRIRTW
jgi:PPOX class probable F420-dependent enzyme